jgi:hypothetical protein
MDGGGHFVLRARDLQAGIAGEGIHALGIGGHEAEAAHGDGGADHGEVLGIHQSHSSWERSYSWRGNALFAR